MNFKKSKTYNSPEGLITIIANDEYTTEFGIKTRRIVYFKVKTHIADTFILNSDFGQETVKLNKIPKSK